MANHEKDKIQLNPTYEYKLKEPASKPVETVAMTLTPKQVNDISLLMGGTLIRNAEELVAKLKQSQQVRSKEGFTLDLDTDTLWALKQQSLGMTTDYEQYVGQFVKDAVHWQLYGFVRVV